MTPFRPSPTPRIIASMISSRAIARAIARKHENNEDTKVSSIFKWFAMIVAITFGLGFGLYVGAWIAGSLNNIHLALRIVFLVKKGMKYVLVEVISHSYELKENEQ